MLDMLLGKDKQEKRRHHSNSHRRGLIEKFHKLVLLVGLAITYRGLKGWLRDKKRKMMH